MKIIDADKLLNKIDAYMCGSQDVMFVKELIKEQPTAFDVDKVVEQLEETREKDIPRINNTTTKRDEKVYKLAMSYAIDIVKAGGLDE